MVPAHNPEDGTALDHRVGVFSPVNWSDDKSQDLQALMVLVGAFFGWIFAGLVAIGVLLALVFG